MIEAKPLKSETPDNGQQPVSVLDVYDLVLARKKKLYKIGC